MTTAATVATSSSSMTDPKPAAATAALSESTLLAADSSSAWLEDESTGEFSTVSGWNESRYHLNATDPPLVEQAMERLQQFYDLQQQQQQEQQQPVGNSNTSALTNNSTKNDHNLFYQAFKQAFDKHATGLLHPFGTSIADMKKPQLRQSYTSADDLYFDLYRPYLSLHHPVQIIDIGCPMEEEKEEEDNDDNDDKNNPPSRTPSSFAFTTQLEYAGKVLITEYQCLVRNGRIVRMEQGDTDVVDPATAKAAFAAAAAATAAEDPADHGAAPTTTPSSSFSTAASAACDSASNDSKNKRYRRRPRPFKKLWHTVQKYSAAAS
ncbi:hypothetical protein ACA910_018548 [Epithemia clementina (nom. ined.)]